MKEHSVLIYVNENKDPYHKCVEKLEKTLSANGVRYSFLEENSEMDGSSYEALFVIGGDGTILRRTEFANRFSLPVIGINAGKLGFLSEFEQGEIEEAVSSFLKGELESDARATLEIDYKGKKFLGLNDAVVQRVYSESNGMVITCTVSVDGTDIDAITGDGVIICTPTGSTAYSLSVGGAILAPGINAFSVTPIAAHSFSQRPVIFSAQSACSVSYDGGSSAGLFVDGKMVAVLEKGDKITINKAEKPTVFLRKKDYAFYAKLSCKLKDRAGF